MRFFLSLRIAFRNLEVRIGLISLFSRLFVVVRLKGCALSIMVG